MIAVLGAESGAPDAARALGLGLGDLGEVVALGRPAPPPASDPGSSSDEGLTTLNCAMTSAADVADFLARAEDVAGNLHAVVLVSAGRATTAHGDLAELDHGQFHQRVEMPLHRTWSCFQGAHRRLQARGGGLVVLVPTLALVGSSGFAPWAAVAEGQRSLAKAAARAWGSEGIAVNCVAVPGALLGGPWPGGVPDRPGQPPPVLAPPVDLRTAVAPVVASLVSGPWSTVTGATIAVDGGVWMTP